MARTIVHAGHGEIEWRRPRTASHAAERRWFGQQERPSFLQLLVPLVALAIGSILAFGAILLVLVLVLTALF